MGGPHKATFGMFAAGQRKAALACDRIIPPTEPVDRDPCPRCGVRRDYGCSHSLAPLGTML